MTKGSYIQLAANSDQDVNIGDEHSFWSMTEQGRPSSFSLNPKEYVLSGAYFGKQVDFSLPMDGDLIRRIYLQVKLPTAQVVPTRAEPIIPVERPLLLQSQTAETLNGFDPNVMMNVAAQRDWTGIFYNELLLFLNDNVSALFPQPDMINFLELNTFALEPETILRKVLDAAAENLESYDETTVSLALTGLLTMYVDYTSAPLFPLVKLLDPLRYLSPTQIVENWVDSVVIETSQYTPDSLILITLLRDDLLVRLSEVVSTINNRLNLPSLKPNAQSVPDYRTFLNKSLEERGIGTPEIRYEWYMDTLTCGTTEDVSAYYSQPSRLSLELVQRLHDEFVGETLDVDEAIQILMLGVLEMRTTIINIEPGTLQGSLNSIDIPESMNQEEALYIQGIFEDLKVIIQRSVSQQVFYTSTALAINQTIDYASRATPRAYFIKLLYQDIPEIDDTIRATSSFFRGFLGILEFADAVVKKVFPLEKSPKFQFEDTTTVFQYIWNGELFPFTVDAGEISIDSLSILLEGVMVERKHFAVLEDTTQVFFLGIRYSEENANIVFTSAVVPTGAGDLMFPDEFEFPELPFAPQLVVENFNPFSSFAGFTPGTYGSPTDASVVYSDAVYWSRLLSYRIYVTTLLNAYRDYSDKIQAYIGGTTPLLEGLRPGTTVDPYLVQLAFDALDYPQRSATRLSKYDVFIQKHAIIGEAFLEEMYCEYTFDLMPKDWFAFLQLKGEQWDLTEYETQVLLSYHLDDVEYRSPRVAHLIRTSINDFLDKARCIGYTKLLRSLLTWEQYVEFSRTNEPHFNYVYREWEKKVTQQKIWRVVKRLETQVPATVIEEHHLFRAFSPALSSIDPEEGGVLVTIDNQPYPAGRFQTEITSIAFVKAAAIYLFSENYYYGEEQEILWDGNGTTPTIHQTAQPSRSVLILPYRFRKGGSLRPFKCLWMVHPEDEDEMRCSDIDVVSMSRRLVPSPVFIEYERLRWRLYGDFNAINRRQPPKLARPGKDKTECSDPQEVPWRDSVGLHILDEVSISTNNRVIETLTPTTQILYHEYLEKRFGIREAYNRMMSDAILTIPIPFWFSRAPHTALPIVSAAYSGLSLRFRFNHINELLKFSNVELGTNASFRLLIEYVYLSEPERALFVKERHIYVSLVSQTDVYTNIPLRLNLKGPVSDAFVFFCRKGSASPYEAVSAVRRIRLNINGTATNAEDHAVWSSHVVHACRFPGPGLPSVHVFPFALYPSEMQPSGSLNFDGVTDTRLDVEFLEGVDPLDLVMVVFYRRYVIMQVASGMLSTLHE